MTKQLQAEDAAAAAKIAAEKAAEDEKSERERIRRNARRRETREGRKRALLNPVHSLLDDPVADRAIVVAAKAEKKEAQRLAKNARNRASRLTQKMKRFERSAADQGFSPEEIEGKLPLFLSFFVILIFVQWSDGRVWYVVGWLVGTAIGLNSLTKAFGI